MRRELRDGMSQRPQSEAREGRGLVQNQEQSWGQRSGFQTRGHGASHAPGHLPPCGPQSSGVDKLPSFSLAACPEGSPLPGLRRKKVMAWMTMSPAKRSFE